MNFYLIAELILYMIFFKHAFLKTEKMKILHFEKRVICSSPFLKMKESIFSAFKKKSPSSENQGYSRSARSREDKSVDLSTPNKKFAYWQS